MSHLSQLIAPGTTLAANALIAAAWQGTLLVLLALLGLRLFPAISAAARSIVWLAALLLLVLLNLVPVLDRPTSIASAHAPRLLHVDPRWSIALAALWVALSILRGIQLLRSAIALHSLTRRATPLPVEPSLAGLLQTRHAQLCSSADVDRPSVVGFFSPKVLLPHELVASITAAQLEPIVRHEMEHLRRRDDWTNLLQKLALALFPLSPALLWVEHRLCHERELACDDGVLRATTARKAYATSLATLAEHSLLRRSITLALAAWDKPSALETRIRRILYRPERTMTPAMTAAAVSLLVIATTIGSCLVARSPQLITFTPAQLPQSTAILASAPPPPNAPAPPHITRVRAIRHRPSHLPHLTLTHWQRPIPMRLPPPPSFEAIQINLTYAAVPVPNGWLIIRL